MKKLTSRAWKGPQTIEYESTWITDDEFRLRVQIKRDFYDFQSHLRCQIWSPSQGQWNEISTLPLDHSKIKKSRSCTEVALGLFLADERQLIADALLICEVP